MAVLPVVRGTEHAKSAVVAWSIALAAVTLLPAWLGVVRLPYLWVAAPSAMAFVALALTGLRAGASARWARRLFFASMPYLVVVYAAFVAEAV
jgi:protoheme IX farnesyltransferase